MVGVILQAALAGHYCYLSQGPGGWGPWREKVGGEDGQKEGHPLLPSGIHPLHPPAVSKAKEKVPIHARTGQDWDCPLR